MAVRRLWAGMTCLVVGLLCTGCAWSVEEATRQAERTTIDEWWDECGEEYGEWWDEFREQQDALPSVLEFEGTIVALDVGGRGGESPRVVIVEDGRLGGGAVRAEAILLVEFADGQTLVVCPFKYVLRVGATYWLRLVYDGNGLWYLWYLEER